MKKIAITGSSGVIGTVLSAGLRKHYDLTLIDKNPSTPDTFKIDLANEYEKLSSTISGHDAIIHLAWNTEVENFRSGKIDPDNRKMAYRVYEAASQRKIPRVLMASSVHADDYSKWQGPGLMSPDKVPVPDSPYGASKVYVEVLGRYYAKKYGMEIVCIRFGEVNKTNEIPEDYWESMVYLSHLDCFSLVRKAVEVAKIPDNFTIVNGISFNKNRVHDNSNLLGWNSRDF